MAENQSRTLLEQKGYWDLFSEGDQFENVLQSPELNVLIEHWPIYGSVKIIVVGSSPAPCFDSTGGFVGENTGTYLPPTVMKLRETLNSAYYNNNPAEGDDSYDYHATHSKMDHGILFINVCLQQISNKFSEFSIGFINRILRNKRLDDKQLLVLDMRLDKHIHESESTFSKFSHMRRTELSYKLESLNFHQLVRLGHPNDFDSHLLAVVEELRSIRTSYPEVASIYRTQQTCVSNKILKLRSQLIIISFIFRLLQ